MATNETLLDEHFAAENDHDLERLLATFADGAVVVLNGQPIEGKPAIREFYRTFGWSTGGSFDELHLVERHRHRLEGVVIVEQTLSGRHAGQWMGIDASGRTFKVDLCAIYELDDAGKITCERLYFDMRWIERQIWS
jgi:steroid delta-isomerase-like uncharacterized protein